MTEKETVREDLGEEGYPLEDRTINLDKDEHIISTSFLIPRDLLKQLGYIAVEEGVSRGEIIRKCVKEYLGSHNPKSKDEGYTKKVGKVKELLKKLEKQKMTVNMETDDLFPENIDNTVKTLEEAITEPET